MSVNLNLILIARLKKLAISTEAVYTLSCTGIPGIIVQRSSASRDLTTLRSPGRSPGHQSTCSASPATKAVSVSTTPTHPAESAFNGPVSDSPPGSGWCCSSAPSRLSGPEARRTCPCLQVIIVSKARLNMRYCTGAYAEARATPFAHCVTSQIEDDDFLHKLRILKDRDSGGVRLEAVVMRGELRRTPVWTVFGKNSRSISLHGHTHWA